MVGLDGHLAGTALGCQEHLSGLIMGCLLGTVKRRQ